MGKFRVRVSAKGKRWKKGQSSSSNPTSTKFRDAARSGFFQVQPADGKPSRLTTDAVALHNGQPVPDEATDIAICHALLQSGVPPDRLPQLAWDQGSVATSQGTSKTSDTFASDWTRCSNVTFHKLLKNFRSDSAVDKEVIAVLAALRQVINDRVGTESSTEYYAAIITALEGSDDGSLYPLMTLLSVIIRAVPLPVLRTTFSHTAKTLMKLLAESAQSDNVSILRLIIGCLSVCLRPLDSHAWDDPFTLQVLDSVLTFITFSKSKPRKAAQHGVKALVLNKDVSAQVVDRVAAHCLQVMQNVTASSMTSVLHVLSLLRHIMHKFHKKQLKEGLEACLKLMSMQNVLVSSCCLQTLHSMLKASPSPGSLPPDRNARLIAALYDYQPPPSDAQPTQAWMATLLQAHLNLYRNDVNGCLNSVGRLVTTLSQLYLTEKPQVMTSVTHSLTDLIETVFYPPSTPEMEVDGGGEAEVDKEKREPSVSEMHLSVAESLSTHLRDLLSYQYHCSWTHVLHLIRSLFQTCRRAEYSARLKGCISALATLRDTNQFSYNNEVEAALSAAVTSLGPAVLIDSLPLSTGGGAEGLELKRSWMLPVLKNSVKHSELKMFIDYFLPLAARCKKESERLKGVNDSIGSVSYDLLQSQIWSLLPSFSDRPTDLAASFPVIAKALGGVLNSRKDLRISVLSSLRKLVNFSVESGSKADAETMARFSKNYLPILFSIYSTPAVGTDDDATRLATLDTIAVYLKVSDSDLRSELFGKAVEKLGERDKEVFVRAAVLDLVRTLTRYLNGEQLLSIYSVVQDALAQPRLDHKLQKKYFRLLEEMLKCDSQPCTEFLSTRQASVRDLILHSLPTSASSSRGARLRCLVEVLKREERADSVISSGLAETVLSVKDINSRTRDTAYTLLAAMADASQPPEFLSAVSAGLAGTPSTIAASLLALAAVIYHYGDRVPAEAEDEVVHSVMVLTMCNTREVVTAALSFFKVYIVSRPRQRIADFLPNLMNLFSKMNEDTKKACRTKIRDLLARLVRWFGGDTVLNCVDPEDTVLRSRVRNQSKIHARRLRIREQSKQERSEAKVSRDEFAAAPKSKTMEEILAESDSEEDEDGAMDVDSGKRRAWITETPGDIVDFTDLSTTKKISGSKPESNAGGAQGVGRFEDKKNRKKSGDMKRAPDGRLIIADLLKDSDDDDPKPSTSNFLQNSDDDYIGSEDDEVSVAASQPRKRALSVSTSASRPNKYRAGGGGIHRPLKKILGKEDGGHVKGRRSGSGAEYRASKAGGDVKRKGAPDPYAYVPLRRDNLNKRKKMKAAGQFKNFIKGARKGAKMGAAKKQKQKARR